MRVGKDRCIAVCKHCQAACIVREAEEADDGRNHVSRLSTSTHTCAHTRTRRALPGATSSTFSRAHIDALICVLLAAVGYTKTEAQVARHRLNVAGRGTLERENDVAHFRSAVSASRSGLDAAAKHSLDYAPSLP